MFLIAKSLHFHVHLDSANSGPLRSRFIYRLNRVASTPPFLATAYDRDGVSPSTRSTTTSIPLALFSKTLTLLIYDVIHFQRF